MKPVSKIARFAVLALLGAIMWFAMPTDAESLGASATVETPLLSD